MAPVVPSCQPHATCCCVSTGMSCIPRASLSLGCCRSRSTSSMSGSMQGMTTCWWMSEPREGTGCRLWGAGFRVWWRPGRVAMMGRSTAVTAVYNHRRPSPLSSPPSLLLILDISASILHSTACRHYAFLANMRCTCSLATFAQRVNHAPQSHPLLTQTSLSHSVLRTGSACASQQWTL